MRQVNHEVSKDYLQPCKNEPSEGTYKVKRKHSAPTHCLMQAQEGSRHKARAAVSKDRAEALRKQVLANVLQRFMR